jgi:nucleoside-diphosphate-sugar epimerase
LARACLFWYPFPPRNNNNKEKDWNPITWDEALKTDQHITGYRASKTFAEKAAWDFLDEKKPHFDIITIQPPLVFGPYEHDVTLETLNESNSQIWRIISSGPDAIVPPTAVFRWVDVRDVATAHVNAIYFSVKGNQRFLVSGGEFTWQKVTRLYDRINDQIVDIANEKFPGKNIPKGDPTYRLPEPRYTFDVSSGQSQLNLKWTSLEKSVTDLLTQLFALQKREAKS